MNLPDNYFDKHRERVDHSFTPEQMARVGRDVENVVLARAVHWHVEHRVLLNESKAVVFK